MTQARRLADDDWTHPLRDVSMFIRQRAAVLAPGAGSLVTWTILVLVITGDASQSTGASPATSTLAGGLFRTTPLTMTVQNEPLAGVLDSILNAVNRTSNSSNTLWLARTVDPDQPITLNQAGPTAAACMIQLAQASDLVIFPLPNVLLVGPEDWVDRTLGGVMRLPAPPSGATDPISVHWGDGTTATNVLQRIIDPSKPAAPAGAAGEEAGWLPHDVWRAGKLTGVDRNVAIALVLAQFRCDFRPTATTPPLEVLAERLPASVIRWGNPESRLAITLAYGNLGDAAIEVRRDVKRRDPLAQFRPLGSELIVATTAMAHREAVRLIWRQEQPAGPATVAAAGKTATTTTFDLKLLNKPAGAVIAQLATAAGKKFRLEDAATLRAEQLVSLEAKTETLEALAGRVAEMAGLSVTWGEEVVVGLGDSF